jgi:hypothetical protein
VRSSSHPCVLCTPLTSLLSSYGDIIAYDSTRCLPPLRTTRSDDEASYVNASLVRELDLGLPSEKLKRRWWVAAQVSLAF